MPDRTALDISRLGKRYETGTEALTDVSLSIDEGDFFALLGPNGAGKSTLIGIVTGIVNKTSGKVSVFGHDIDREPGHARSAIGVVPQELNFNIFEKPIDIVVNQAGYYGIPRREALPRAERLLDDLGLGDKKRLPSRALSGGMKRRLMIARALVHRPRFLILDEPTAGVDVELRRGMWEYLSGLSAEGLTVLLTTHYLEEAEQLCRNLAIINKGRIIAQGTMKDILGRLKTETVILDLSRPVSDDLLGALSAYSARKTDETSVEIEIGDGRGINAAILLMNDRGFPVQTVRSKSNRLEEVFVRLTSE